MVARVTHDQHVSARQTQGGQGGGVFYCTTHEPAVQFSFANPSWWCLLQVEEAVAVLQAHQAKKDATQKAGVAAATATS